MLTLPIKRQWYDEILSGKKTIEYRDFKPYWTSRFLKATGLDCKSTDSEDYLTTRFNHQKQLFDVKFKNGYEPDSPSFIAECWVDIGPEVPYGNPYYHYYRLHIVNIKETAQ